MTAPLKDPPEGQLLAFLGIFAFLVCNTAAGLTSRLAGGLAFTAAAVFCAIAEVASFESFDMLHFFILRDFSLF